MAMLANVIAGFIAILIGISLIGTISNEVNSATISTGALQSTTGWGATVLDLVPGFFAISILGVGIAVIYSAMREAGIA